MYALRCFFLCMVFVVLSHGPVAAQPTGVEFKEKQTCAVVEDGSLFDQDRFTVAVRVKLLDQAGSQVFMSRGGAGDLFTLYLYQDRVRMLVEYSPNEYTHANVPAPPPDQWVHFAGTYDGRVIKLYVDGALKAEVKAEGRIPESAQPLAIGALAPGRRVLDGLLDHVCFFDTVLSPEFIKDLSAGEKPNPDHLIACWTAEGADEEVWKSALAGGPDAVWKSAGTRLICRPADGYRGIWYSNQPQGDKYVYKYSGGLSTYCAKHRPFAVYAPEVNKTFFCYGGSRGEGKDRTLLHMVSYYDHEKDQVPRPTVLMDKRTTDAHDNPVISIDDQGYIWIFSSAHGTARPAFISVSEKPYSVERFELVQTFNYSYPQPYYLAGQGFLFLHTRYGEGGRRLFQMTSTDGRTWSEPEKLAMIEKGHYQISRPCGKKIGTAFNMHPSPRGLNWRTNLYYMETEDLGKTWRNVEGEKVELPLTDVENPTLVRDFSAEKRNVYMKDLAHDAKGRPVILFLTSGGWQSGPVNDPRTWQTARWTGKKWELRSITDSDNNYDTGSLYIEENGCWRVIGPTAPGPQAFNTGGEIEIWTSQDQGDAWERSRQLTRDSRFNHGYCRKPINAHPEFYSLWADGHGRKVSTSRLYFCNREGSEVFMLPPEMDGEFAQPAASADSRSLLERTGTDDRGRAADSGTD